MKVIKAMTRRLVQVPGLVTLGHYAGWPCALLALAMRVAAVLWGYAACYAVGALLAPFLLSLLAHGSGICPRGACGVLMSATPTDEAARYRWWLHHVHHQLASKVTWALLASWFVITFVIVNPILSAVPVIALLYVDSLDPHFCEEHDLARLQKFSRIIAKAVGESSTESAPASPANVWETYLERTPVEDMEREKLLLLLNRNEWNIARVARLMGVTRRTVYLRLQRYNIPRERVAKSRPRGTSSSRASEEPSA